jgi:hypothetical protein
LQGFEDDDNDQVLGNSSSGGIYTTTASSLPRDNRHAQREQSMRSPLTKTSPSPSTLSAKSSNLQPFPSLDSNNSISVPFPLMGGDAFDKTEPPVVVKARTRTRSSGLETTLERVLSSSLLGFNEGDPLSPTGAKASQKKIDFPDHRHAPNPAVSQAPSKLSELMGDTLPKIQDGGEESPLQGPQLKMNKSMASSSQEDGDFGFIEPEDEMLDDNDGGGGGNRSGLTHHPVEEQPLPLPPVQTKFGSGNFSMFVGSQEDRTPAQITIPRTSFGSLNKNRSNSYSPLSDNGSHVGSVTALSILSSSRSGKNPPPSALFHLYLLEISIVFPTSTTNVVILTPSPSLSLLSFIFFFFSVFS